MASRKEIFDRRIRLIQAVQGRRFEDVYLQDPVFRKDLEDEAKLGRKRPNDALCTPETLRELETSVDRWLKGGPVAAFAAGAAAPRAVARRGKPRARDADSQIVVIVPGCALNSLYDIGDRQRWLWYNFVALVGGGILNLQLAAYDGNERDKIPGVKIIARGLTLGIYNNLEDALQSNGFATMTYDFDWRKDVDHEASARGLKELILDLSSKWSVVHIVAHSLGGLVARRALQCLCKQIGKDKTLKIVGRVVLLGPSVKGTFAAALGLGGSLSELPFFGLLPPTGENARHTMTTFTSLYQLLPADDRVLPSLKTNDVRTPGFWRLPIDDTRLLYAFPTPEQAWSAGVDTQFLKDRTAVILGYRRGCNTAGGVEFDGDTLNINCYVEGDGFVPHCCSILPETKSYLAEGVAHIGLPKDAGVIQTTIDVINGVAKPYLPEFSPKCPEGSTAKRRVIRARSGAAQRGRNQ